MENSGNLSTAIEGEWIEAPGYEVLDMLTEKLPDVELIAEDLGDLRPEVLTLKEHYHLKGMKVLEFVLDTSGKYAVDSFSDEENMIVYTGTHDNSTLMEWYHELSVPSRRKIRRFLKRQGIKKRFCTGQASGIYLEKQSRVRNCSSF